MACSDPELGTASMAALRAYRRLLVAEPGSATERALTEQLAYLVDRIPEGEMRSYASGVVKTVNQVRRR